MFTDIFLKVAYKKEIFYPEQNNDPIVAVCKKIAA
jgi:hypothetical protein